MTGMQRHNYSLKPDVRSPGDKKYRDFFASSPLPKSMDYRSKMPPVWDQGPLGACQSYAIDAIDAYIKGYAFIPSHIFTYYNVRKIEGTIEQDSGGTLSDTCHAVKEYGICDAEIWPNDNSLFAVEPSPEAYADGKAGDDAIYEFYRVSSVDEARQALAAGRLPYIGLRIYENFESASTLSSGIIPAPRGKLLGGHALVIVGYYDEKVSSCPLLRLFRKTAASGYFILRNSWGTGIGLDGTGYFKCSYAVFEKLLMDMWVIVR